MHVQSKPHARRVLYVAPIFEGELLKDNLIPYTSEYTQLGYVYQVDMEGHDSTGWTLGRILAMETCRPN